MPPAIFEVSMKRLAHFSFVSSPSQGGSRRKALAFALTFAGSLQGQTALTDLHLSGTNNQITNGAEMTVLGGGSLTAAAGSVIDLFHATVALPPALTLTNLRLDGASTELINGARLTLLSGSTFATASGSTMDLSSATISFPTTVVLTTSEQTLTGKTLVSPIISAISAAATSNLSLTAGSAGASLTLGAGADASVSFTGLRLVLADGPYTSDYVSVPNMFIGLGAGKAGNRSRANIGIGINALGNATTASENIAIGWNALAMTDGIPPAQGSNMIAIGPQALEQNTTGGDHVAIGRRSMQNNTTGVDNTAVGYYSMTSNTIGSYNVALGNIALRSNTAGYHSVAVGQSALTSAVSSENTAVGANAGFRTTTGTRNVFVGFDSAWENVGGSFNTAIGENSLGNAQSHNNTAIGSGTGGTLTTGGNNTFLGAKSDVSSNSLTNVTAIGFQALATASNQMALGNGDVTQVRLGAGPIVAFGNDTPEGAVAAPISSLFLRKNGASGTALYVKEDTSGTGTTGWTPVTTGIGGTVGNVLVNGVVSHQSGTVVLSLPTGLTSIRNISSDTGALVLNGASGIVRVDDNASYGGAEFFVNGGNSGFALLTMRRLNTSNPAEIHFYTGTTQKWDWGLDADGTDNLMIYNRSTGVYPFRMWAADNSLSLYGSTDAAMDGSGALKVGGGIFSGKKIVSATDLVAGANIVAAGGLSTTATTASTSGSTGALVVAGGFGLAGNQFMGGSLNFTGPGLIASSGSLSLTAGGSNQNITLSPSGAGILSTAAPFSAAGPITTSATTASTSTGTGALIVAGGFGLAGNQYLGGSLNLSGGGVLTGSAGSLSLTAGGTDKDITLTPSGTGRVVFAGPVTFSGNQTFTTGVGLSGGGSVAGTAGSVSLTAAGTNQNITLAPSGSGLVTTPAAFRAGGALSTTATTASTSSTTGALVVAGGFGLAGNFFTAGSVNFTGPGVIAAGGSLSLSAGGTNQNITLTPSGSGLLSTAAPFTAAGAITTNATTASTSTSTGALVVAGGFGLAGNQFLGGSLNLTGGGVLTGTAGSLALTAGGTNQTITLTPSGTGGVAVSGPLSASGPVTVSSTTNSTSTNTGALVVVGGAGIQKKTSLGDDLLLTPTTSTGATLRLSGTTVADTPGIWFRDGGSPTAANAALSGSSTATILNGPSGGTVNLRIANTNYLTLAPTAATLQGVPLNVTATTASISQTTGSATFGGGIGVNGRTSTKTLAVGNGAALDLILTTISVLDFPSIAANGGVQDLTVTLTGANLGDSITVVEANGSFIPAGVVLRAIVTATNTVTVRATNVTAAAIDPASAAYRITLFSF